MSNEKLENVLKFKSGQVTVPGVIDALKEDEKSFDEIYVVTFVEGRAQFYLCGDIKGAVLASAVLKDQMLQLMKGEIE